jgi:hypothetical protein
MTLGPRKTVRSLETTLESPVTISSGESIYVWGIDLTNNGTSGQVTITATTADTAQDTIFEMLINNRTTKLINIPILADRGIRFSAVGSGGGSAEDAHVKIHFSQAGA